MTITGISSLKRATSVQITARGATAHGSATPVPLDTQTTESGRAFVTATVGQTILWSQILVSAKPVKDSEKTQASLLRSAMSVSRDVPPAQ